MKAYVIYPGSQGGDIIELPEGDEMLPKLQEIVGGYVERHTLNFSHIKPSEPSDGLPPARFPIAGRTIDMILHEDAKLQGDTRHNYLASTILEIGGKAGHVVGVAVLLDGTLP